MVNINGKLEIEETRHYRVFHKKEVPIYQVLKIISSTRAKRKGKDIFEYKTKRFYVLCRREGNIFKVINAKRK
jgi:hypothetical protein